MSHIEQNKVVDYGGIALGLGGILFLIMFWPAFAISWWIDAVLEGFDASEGLRSSWTSGISQWVFFLVIEVSIVILFQLARYIKIIWLFLVCLYIFSIGLTLAQVSAGNTDPKPFQTKEEIAAVNKFLEEWDKKWAAGAEEREKEMAEDERKANLMQERFDKRQEEIDNKFYQYVEEREREKNK